MGDNQLPFDQISAGVQPGQHDHVDDVQTVMFSGPAVWLSAAMGLFMVVSGLMFSWPLTGMAELLVVGAGVFLMSVGGYGVVRAWPDMGVRHRVFGVAAVSVAGALFVVGAVTQDVLNGRPVFELSGTAAQLDRFSRLLDDMDLVRSLDAASAADPVLLKADPAEVERLNREALARAASLLSSTPDGDLGVLAVSTADLLEHGAAAVTAAYDAAVQPQDGRRDSFLTARREFGVRLEATVREYVRFSNSSGFPVRSWMEVAAAEENV